MDLDSFLISILFDTNKTNDSAKKIENIVTNLTGKIVAAFSAIASVDFLNNAVESSIKLTTQLDNLSYMTNISKENLNAWGEAVKRNGGTTEGFYNSVSNLSQKIRDLQTSFGSAGQLAFQRLQLNLVNANGHVKNSVELFGDLAEKFKTLPKVWQLNLGQMLGLDSATIRLLSQGNEAAQKLVQNMIKLGGINNLNTERNIKLRNSLYDLELIWQNIKITIANIVTPVIQRFSDLLIKSFLFLREHSTAIKVALLIFAGILSGVLLRAIVGVTSALIKMAVAMAINPINLYILAIIVLALVLDDFLGYLEGKQSALESFYKAIAGTAFIKGIKYMTHALQDFADVLKIINGFTSKIFGKSFELGNIPDWVTKDVPGYKDYKESLENKNDPNKSIKDIIKDKALKSGLDPNIAGTIANIESQFNPNAKNDLSTASGIFGLTNKTALDNGIKNLSKKNDLMTNINAGINNLRNVTIGLTKFFNHAPTGGETYLGEMLGLKGSKRLFSADRDTMFSQLFNPSVLKANPQFNNLTAGQVINSANKTYQQKSVTIGDVNINAPNSNAHDIVKKIVGLMQQQYSSLVTNLDNGVRL